MSNPDLEVSYSYSSLAAIHNVEPWASQFHEILNDMHENNKSGEITIKIEHGMVTEVNTEEINKFV